MSRSEQQTPDQKEVRRKASRYILEKLGDRLWAGAPTYDERRERWTVPIHSRALPAEELGHITLDTYGEVVRAPSRRALQRAVQHHLPGEAHAGLVAAIHDMLTGVPSLALARGGGTVEGTRSEDEPLPTLEALGRDLQQLFAADPDLFTAFKNLRLALADPQMRPNVLAALEAFARAAKKDEGVKE